jgi:hypothetical protein
MSAQLNYTMVQHRSVELRRACERAQIEAPARRRRLRNQNTVTGPSAEPGHKTISLELERTIGGER